jgi:hypothetical protein
VFPWSEFSIIHHGEHRGQGEVTDRKEAKNTERVFLKLYRFGASAVQRSGIMKTL